MSRDPPQSRSATRNLEDANRRNASAFTGIYLQYFQAVRDFILSRGGRDVADDLAQEVFLQLWRGKCAFRGASSIKTYLLAVATRKLREAGRSTARADRALKHLPHSDGVARGEKAAVHELTEVEANACSHEREHALAKRLAQLPEDRRKPIELILEGGLPLTAVARRLGCPESTLRCRVRASLRQLSRMAGFSDDRGGMASIRSTTGNDRPTCRTPPEF